MKYPERSRKVEKPSFVCERVHPADPASSTYCIPYDVSRQGMQNHTNTLITSNYSEENDIGRTTPGAICRGTTSRRRNTSSICPKPSSHWRSWSSLKSLTRKRFVIFCAFNWLTQTMTYSKDLQAYFKANAQTRVMNLRPGGGTKASRTLLTLYRRLRSCKSKLMNWWRWWWVGMILIIMLMMIWWWWWRRRWWGWGWGWGRGRGRRRRQLPIPC